MSQSASGKADSGNTPDDKVSSVECPTCGKDGFANPMGMRSHHKQVHGESIAKDRELDEVECDNCGELFGKQPWKIEKHTYNYCSRDCKHAHDGLADLIGDIHRERIEKECSVCGTEFDVIPFREDSAKYCSRECRVEATKELTGNARYNYKTQSYECAECGSEVQRSPSEVYSEDRVFCTKRCYDEHRRNGYEQYYGRNWNKQRREVLQRDQYRCQSCGKNASELYREPDVHHIKPIEWFKENYDEPEWYEKGNQTSNLVVFCPPCHREWEGVPVKPTFIFDPS